MSAWFLKLKNHESGPFETDDLLRLIPESKIAKASVRKELSDPWRPLSSFPELLLALPRLSNDSVIKPPSLYTRPWFALLVLLSLSSLVVLLLALPKKPIPPLKLPDLPPKASTEALDFQKLREHQDLVLQEQHENRKKQLLLLSPSQREHELTTACDATCEELDLALICQTASSPEEQATLEQKAKSLQKSWSINQPKILREQAQKAREDYAKSLATSMLNQHINHRSVEALGPEKTSLQVTAIFCSPRFIQDAETGELRNVAKALGFKKILCKSRETTWSTDL